MNVQGLAVPLSGHLAPLGQHTSPGNWSLMACRVQLKQNLWPGFEGHWTKSEPSRREVQFIQFMSSLEEGGGGTVVVVVSCSGSLAAGGSDFTLSATAAAAARVLVRVSAVVRVAEVVRAEVWMGREERVVVVAELVGEKALSLFIRFSWE